MGTKKGKKSKNKKVVEPVEEPKKRGNAENLTPKEKVVIPPALLKKIKKNRPDVYKIIQELQAARESGDDTAQRKARMSLRKAGFYLSKLEAGEDPFLTEEEAKSRKASSKKKSKKSKEEDVDEEEVDEDEEDEEEEDEEDEEEDEEDEEEEEDEDEDEK